MIKKSIINVILVTLFVSCKVTLVNADPTFHSSIDAKIESTIMNDGSGMSAKFLTFVAVANQGTNCITTFQNGNETAKLCVKESGHCLQVYKGKLFFEVKKLCPTPIIDSCSTEELKNQAKKNALNKLSEQCKSKINT